MVRLMDLKQVCQILNVSYSRACELARTGVLPCVRIGRTIRVHAEKLDEFIERGGFRLPGGWRRRPPEHAEGTA
jgi:excisionase family DNA binding protein